MGIAMVHPVEPRRERPEGMAKPSVNEVFEKCPQEHARYEQGTILDHDAILSDRSLKALSGRDHHSAQLPG